ncbi:MAG: hypothetical protein AAFY82_01860 [Pseudomonadota bacterium]
MSKYFVFRLFISFLIRFILAMLVSAALLGVVTGFVAGLSGTDLRLTNYGFAHWCFLAVPVTFWALYSALNGNYRRFEIIIREKAISGD